MHDEDDTVTQGEISGGSRTSLTIKRMSSSLSQREIGRAHRRDL